MQSWIYEVSTETLGCETTSQMLIADYLFISRSYEQLCLSGWVTACKTGIKRHLTVNNTGSYTRFINKVAWGESLSTTDQTAGAASVHVQLKSGMHLNWEVWSMFKSRQIFKQPHVQDGRTASHHKSHEHCSALKSLMKSCVLHKAASLSLEDYY